MQKFGRLSRFVEVGEVIMEFIGIYLLLKYLRLILMCW